VGLKLNGTHHLLDYADDMNLLENNINTIKKNTQTLIDARKEVGLKINAKKTKRILLSCHQNVGQSHDIKIANRSFGNVAQLKYFGTTVTNQNLIREELRGDRIRVMLATIQSRAFFFSCLLSRNIKIRLHKL
jgi:hypothetical protein